MNDFNLVFPIQKIDREKRVVTGIATADNVDLADDVVEFSGSVEAFDNWIGNIREMHMPIAVGKLVEWTSVPLMHHGKVYNGIEVSVYISTGAQDTWEKILDGTLRGFSIGGYTLEKENKWDEELQRTITVIKRYVLGELSVVDNPCNPAGMFSMIKSVDGKLEYAVAGDTKPVFYCSVDDYASLGDSICPLCSESMTTIGHSEELSEALVTKMISNFKKDQEGEKVMDLQTNETDGSVEAMSVDFTEDQKKTVLSKFGDFLFSRSDEPKTETVTFDSTTSNSVPFGTPNVNITFNKGFMDESNKVTSTEEVTEDVVTDEIEKVADVAAEVSEDDTVATEGEDNMDMEKAVEAFGALLDDKLGIFKAEMTAEIDEKIEKSVSDAKAESDQKLEEVTEEIEKVANTGAIAKSTVVDEDEVEQIEKAAPQESFWGGKFVPVEIAKSLGYDS